MSKELSIYVHIPFCVRKCLYCDFLSFNAEEKKIEEYFNALEKEVILSSEKYSDYCVKSVFFGGGTPSFPKAENICRILEKIKERLRFDADAEISIEVNPASGVMDKLIMYKKAGFNRISIGAQSLNDDELKKLGRVHDAKLFYETFENARNAGFDNINIDVMSALPGQNLDGYLETLKKVISLKPEHISAYSLIVEEGTPFYDMELNLPDEDEDRLMYHETRKVLLESGYHRYEISNYALDGSDENFEKYECYHNKVYWRRGNYLGLGLGAASMIENVRWNNITHFESYIETLTGEEPDIKLIMENEERLSIESQMEEFMFLGLRLIKGVSRDKFEKEFGKSVFEIYGEVIDKYVKMGLLENDGEYLRLTEKGLDVSNTVMADFLFS
ncbi:radical SAM family heme chaperone HemW [Butyrivibrio sp. YAB3001]|uniref:radical SAM family heme chaperone HemW n=1 Tax=Butyrivibrio sp. YAB3001 TaxID=1520812 RepID=UPI0008F653AF|nr:radical SAM family heme chaperone HemW [Butyrivibrio sp. YAB3001]SFB75181.1 oxygen-independent coproporphyrinogen-3 oxidase [Butyrivibrio sp. YAB3001]